MGRKITMARNPWKVVALGSSHAHPPRGHRVPAFPGRCDRALAGRPAEATPGRGTRGRGVHLVLQGRAGPGGERHSRAPLPVLPPPLGAPDARRGRARPDEARAALPRDGGVLRRGRHGRGMAAVPAPALRRHPRALAVSPGAVRLGRPTGSPRRPGHHVLRSGAAVGENRNAVSPGVPEVGGAALRPGGGDLVVRGRVSEAELQDAYAAADAFVLPAVVDRRGDTEGLGVVLLEAMNHRVPVIASAIGGITDIVEDGVSGLLVPPGDAAALAAALERLARAPDLAAGLGGAGQERLRERFSWEAIMRRWAEVYAAAVARQG